MYYDVIQRMAASLHNLHNILEKAEAHAEARKFDAANLLATRLAPDMFPLTRQIQVAADNAKFATARLTGKEAPRDPDDETTIPQLKERLQRTIAFIQSAQPADFDGAAEREARLGFLPGLYMTGHDYLIQFAVPNFYFHLTAAYAILRSSGVELGKRDFIGEITLHPDK